MLLSHKKMFSRQFSNQQSQCNLHKHVIVLLYDFVV